MAPACILTQSSSVPGRASTSSGSARTEQGDLLRAPPSPPSAPKPGTRAVLRVEPNAANPLEVERNRRRSTDRSWIEPGNRRRSMDRYRFADGFWQPSPPEGESRVQNAADRRIGPGLRTASGRGAPPDPECRLESSSRSMRTVPIRDLPRLASRPNLHSRQSPSAVDACGRATRASGAHQGLRISLAHRRGRVTLPSTRTKGEVRNGRGDRKERCDLGHPGRPRGHARQRRRAGRAVGVFRRGPPPAGRDARGAGPVRHQDRERSGDEAPPHS